MDALNELSDVLTSILESPYSLELHVKHIKLASLPELSDQFESAIELLTTFFAAPPQVWQAYLQSKIRILGIPDDFEDTDEIINVDLQNVEAQALKDLFECFRKATSDYLSVPILTKQIKLLILLHASVSSNPQLESLLSEESTRLAINTAVSQGLGHLTEGNTLWNLQIAWELAQLETKELKSSARATLITHIEELHLNRLQQPHSGHEDTLQSYSSFVTKYYNSDVYEDRLVKAAKLRNWPSKMWNNKEKHEITLGSSPSRHKWEAYITSEQKAKSSNDTLLNSLYERVIADFASRRWEGLATSTYDSSALAETQDTLEIFWSGYLNAVRRQSNLQQEYILSQRAVKNIPKNVSVWTKYFRILERYQDTPPTIASKVESVADAYQKAISIFSSNAEVKEIVLAKCSYDRRHMREDDDLSVLVANLEEGISLVRKASREGDPGLSLELFLSSIYQSIDPPLHQLASELWQTTTNHYKSNRLAWSKYLESLISEHEYSKARNVFKNLPYKTIDWPEQLWLEWVNFENLCGSVDDIEECSEKIHNFLIRLRKKREEEALQIQQAWFEASSSVQPQEIQESLNELETLPASETPGSAANSLKRKAESPEGQDSSVKRAKHEDTPKRDRENGTVFVNYLPLTAKEVDLQDLFCDCGKIREIKLSSDKKNSLATVEFVDKESIPAALTKDKKRIHDQEISVHLAWRLTLYVTNFPDDMDDTSIRNLFDKHGEIFDIRWPSKKFKASRRFCYIQYKTLDGATSALSLHGRELTPNQPLSVYVSDPTRRQVRTDASANDREIYVAGLAKSVKEEELRKFFISFGAIRAIRLPLDNSGHSKGFGFIEFEDEISAASALKANNEEFKKRRLAVTLADKRASKPKGESISTRKARTIKVMDLPTNTQEGLLQQTMEKYGKVTRVEVFNKASEALVEFENPNDVGRLLLGQSSVTFGNQQLKLMEHDLPATLQGSTSSVTTFLPRGSRPRAGLGSKRDGNAITTGLAPDGNKDQDDFRRMLNPES